MMEVIVNEAQFLAHYEAIYKTLDQRYDIRGSALSGLVKICLEHRGEIPLERRARFRSFLPEEYFHHVEIATRAQLKSCV
jgi:hypothetical protein